ncbi:hypothetical protein CHS0354_020639 [Potamilus streckersoni]|uniref:STAS domain-containing protein n=1 Tax=Potamilus streckersoni TaxID=2493646 RepID=A0AAE0T2E5_9BIVA|nr:hypothetical protein CHS0354_020639 [Potamilus streckersoni]
MDTVIRKSLEDPPSSLKEGIISIIEEDTEVTIARGGPHCEHLLSRKCIHTQKSINNKYPCTCKEEHSCCSKCANSAASFANTMSPDAVFKLLPILDVVRKYKFRKYFVGDLLGGLSVACLHFPQGMAFGISSSLTPAYGLYTSFFPVILYMIFGTLPYTSMGTHAVIAMATAELVETEASRAFPEGPIALFNNSIEKNATYTATPEDILLYKVSIAAASSFFAGIILFLLGVFRLGIITTYLSTSFIGGFATGAAFHIFTSQIQPALGLQIPLVKGVGRTIFTYIAIFKKISSINIASLIVFLTCAFILILVKDVINEKFKSKLKVPIPIDVIITILATIISHFGTLHENFGVNVVGNIPTGIPKPSIPKLSAFSSVIGKSIEIAALVFFLTISLAKLMAVKHNYEIDDNQELIAYGLANVGSSFFGCFAACGAPPRDLILDALNTKTTLNAAFSNIIMLLFLLFIGPLFKSLPVPVLAAMIIVAVKSLLAQVLKLPSIWRTNRYDFVTWFVTCSTTILIDIPYGLICGIVCSLFVVVLQSQMSHSYFVIKAPEEDIFLNPDKHTGLVDNPEIKIFRMEYSLYYATSDLFQKKLYQKLGDPRMLINSIHSSFPEERELVSEQSSDDLNALKTNVDLLSFKLKDLSNNNADRNDGPVKVDFKENLSNKSKLRFIILDCRHVNFMDIKGANTLKSIVSEYKKVNVTIFLSGCPSFMSKMLENSECFNGISSDEIFFDLETSYAAAQMILEKENKAQKE